MISNNFIRQYMSIHYDKEDSYRNGPLFVLYKHISIRFYYIAKGAAKTFEAEYKYVLDTCTFSLWQMMLSSFEPLMTSVVLSISRISPPS